MITTVIYAFISVALLGAFFGIGLAIAAKYLHVAKDEKLTQLELALPGYNCGACGFAGCSAYAESIFEGKSESLSSCGPGGTETTAKLGEIMGVAVDLTKEKTIARLHCNGGKDNAVKAFEYTGIPDCVAAYSMYQGYKACKYGCLGFGSCAKVCPVNAISKTDDGLVTVNEDLCISCGQCVTICPVGVMKMIPVSSDYVVACNSKDKGAATKKACKVGCIGCKMCEKKSPEGGFKIDNFLASIDYDTKGERAAAAEGCPSKCIVKK